MIFKCYPGETPPHGRIDEVIYFFGIPTMSLDLEPLAWDTVAGNPVYWNGTVWVAYTPGALVLPVDLGVITTPDALADFMIGATATTQKPLVLQLQSGQSANAFEVQDSTGAVLFSVLPDGSVHFANFLYLTSGSSYIQGPLTVISSGVTAGGVTTPDAAAENLLATSTTTKKGLVVQLAFGASVNGFELQASDGTVLFSIDQTGLVTQISGQTAPSPAEGGTATLDGSGAFAVGTIFSHASAVATWGVGVTPVGQLTAVWTGGGIQVYSSAGAADSGAAINWIAV